MRNDPGTVPRFARGFILSEQAIEPPVPDWSHRTVAGLHLAHAPEVSVSCATSGANVVAVIGHFVDTEHWRETDVAVQAAADALGRSDEAFLDLTDAWSGRYLVIFGTDAVLRVMTDATGMRAAFYALDGPFILASHARVAAQAAGAPAEPAWVDYQAMVTEVNSRLVTSAPGRLTPWSRIVFLPANQALDVRTRSLARIFPRGPIGASTTQAAAAFLAPRLAGQVATLVRTGRPVALSLTAGRDSRLSLAASRPVSDAITYFTYRRAGRADTDAEVTAGRTFARALRLKYTVLDVAATVEPPALRDALREATVLSHGRAVVSAYRAAFAPNTITSGRTSGRSVGAGIASRWTRRPTRRRGTTSTRLR